MIDVRDADAFGAWHIPDSGTSVVNVPEADSTRHADEIAVPAGAAVRVICNARQRVAARRARCSTHLA